MSEKDQNLQNSQESKSEESFASLAERLEAKYGITKEDLKGSKESNRSSKEIGQSIKEEISDTTFIDLEQYTKRRSRHIEQKYGLTPMSELVAPKTEDQKKKELDDYLKKHTPAGMMESASKKMNQLNAKANQELNEIKKEEENYPDIYRFLEDSPAFKPDLNIGEKWASQITENVVSETELSRSRRRGGYIYQSWKKGKIGVDKYLILFSMFGAIILPVYLYYRNKKYKEILMAERGIKPGEEVDLENGKWDIDDFSNHRRFYEDKEERKKTIKKLTVQNEIKKLENELYPKGGFKFPTR